MPNDMRIPPAPPKPAPAKPVVIEASATLPGDIHSRQATAYRELVESYVIDSPATLQTAANDRNEINAKWKALDEQRANLKAPILEAGRKIDGFFKPILDALEGARRMMDKKIATYSEQQERIRREAEAKAKQEQEAEAARQREAAAKVEADAKAKAEELQRQAAEAAAKGNAGKAAKLEEKAQNTIAAGAEQAQVLATEAEITASMPTALVAAAPKAKGASISYTYSAEVTDKAALLQHILTNRKDLLAVVTFDQTALNRQASSLKEALDLPGVDLKKTAKVSGR